MAASLKTTRSPLRHVPVELIMILAFSAAIFAVVAVGGAIASALVHPTVWQTAAAYGVPAAAAFGLYWIIAHRL